MKIELEDPDLTGVAVAPWRHFHTGAKVNIQLRGARFIDEARHIGQEKIVTSN